MTMTTPSAALQEIASGQACRDHGNDEVAAAVVIRSEDAAEANVAQGAEDGGDVAVRQGAADDEGLGGGRAGMTVAPLSRALKPSRMLGGQWVRLHSVRF